MTKRTRTTLPPLRRRRVLCRPRCGGGAARLGQNGVMPRSNRPRRAVSGKARSGKASSGQGAGRAAGGKHAAGPAPELDLERARTGIARRESAPDGEWMVRSISASRAAAFSMAASVDSTRRRALPVGARVRADAGGGAPFEAVSLHDLPGAFPLLGDVTGGGDEDPQRLHR